MIAPDRRTLLMGGVAALAAPVRAACGQPAAAQPLPTMAPAAACWTEHLRRYDVVLEPDRAAAEWWAGAPSVVRAADGTFWMAARMRSPEAPRGARGYEIRILRSDDGVLFTPVHRITRDEVPVPGFERPALLIGEAGRFSLYLCGAWQDGPWAILRLDDAERPDRFRADTARPVITAPPRAHDRDVSVHEYKDPVVVRVGDRLHAWVTGYIRQNERTFHFTSDDGDGWTPIGDVNQPAFDLAGWHNFFTRPASLVPLGVGYLFVYEGSSTQWFDPVYNIVTGLAFTFDLRTYVDLTPAAPFAASSTPGRFATWRYSHWLRVGDELWAYAEVARPDDAHEIRRFRFPLTFG